MTQTTNMTNEKNKDQIGAPPVDQDPDDEKQELRCGYGRCRSNCLQKGNNSKGLLGVVCLFVFVQGFLVNGINNVNVSTLERRFDLPSARVAWISSAYDVSAGILCVVLGYVGMFAHKGRLLAITAALMAMGAFVMFLPHLLVGEYELGIKTSDECDVYGNLTRCTQRTSQAHSRLLYVFIAGMILVGTGGSAVFLIGTTWIDDNVQTQNTPVYLGIMHAFGALGPAVGFLAGGAILDNVYVDGNNIISDDVDIAPSDPRWVGAWWIGFLISSILTVITVFLIACFPPVLQDAARNLHKRESQSYRGQGDRETSKEDFGRSCQDVGTSLKIIFTNPPWILCTLAGIVESGAVMAFNTFLPKMLQFQFALTPGMGAIISGAVVVPGAALGQILGGLIPKWAKLKARGMLLQCGICSVIAGAFAPILLLRCNMPTIAGVTHPYHNSIPDSSFSLHDNCNDNCNCTTRSYEPICGTHNMEYFSPCHAGCLYTEFNPEGEQLYNNCSCIAGDSINNTTPSSPDWDAVEGSCNINCNKLYIFMPLFFVIVLATFVSNTGWHAAVIRCVPDKNRSFAYGIQSSIIRLLGNVPGPIIFGMIFDHSCLVWKDDCGSRGSCWIYDNAALSWRLFIIILIVNGCSGFLFFLAAGIYKAPKSQHLTENVVIKENSSITVPPISATEPEYKSVGLQNGEITEATKL